VNIIDIIIILILLMGGVIGFKNGVIRQTVSFVGFFIVVILSYFLKDFVSVILYKFVPFFSFSGSLAGVTTLNILIYEVIAFLLVYVILMAIYHFIVRVTRIVETILKFTVILGIPSKLLGMVVGFIETYIMVFIGLYCLSLPIFQIPMMNESGVRNTILNHTPGLSSAVSKSLNVVNEFADLKEKYKDTTNKNELNKETLDLFLKYNVVRYDTAKELVDSGKLKIDGVESVFQKYEGSK
jgi:uncharacterized membrane protein required for colicin V production